ncbi:hypothetical protein [Caballeronia sp. LjRoot31]|uniref:hypothetical protein n=1 Tax=Caballeronia sp. LjRoot31 TaxID=3342324 RepID=UPI003ECECFF8
MSVLAAARRVSRDAKDAEGAGKCRLYVGADDEQPETNAESKHHGAAGENAWNGR